MTWTRFALGAGALVLTACGPDTTATDTASTQSESSAGPESETDASTTASSGETETGNASETETTGPGYCGGVEFFARPIPLRVVWVVDNSASIDTPFDHDLDSTTPELTARERMADFTDWFFARYPGMDGCHPLAPGLVLAPGPGAPAAPDLASCAVDPAQVVPDVDSQPTFDTAWASRPPPSGSVALADAYAMAANSFMGVPEWEQPVIIVLTGSPPGCGSGDSEAIDNRLFQRMNDAWNDQGIQSVVLKAGPQSGGTGTAVDGVPDNLDLALYWGSLTSVFGSWHYDLDERDEIQALFDIASPSYGDCTYDLTQEPGAPPASADLVDVVAVDGVPYDELQLSEEECEALTGSGGWIWNNAPNRIRLCGDACVATKCEAQSPWPDNGVEVEVPYLCE